MVSQVLQMRVFRERLEGFGQVRDTGVLIYWPHGFGDFVFLATILPFLEPSNRYFITRFGDNNTAVFDGCELLTPLYLGFDSTACQDGTKF